MRNQHKGQRAFALRSNYSAFRDRDQETDKVMIVFIPSEGKIIYSSHGLINQPITELRKKYLQLIGKGFSKCDVVEVVPIQHGAHMDDLTVPLEATLTTEESMGIHFMETNYASDLAKDELIKIL